MAHKCRKCQKDLSLFASVCPSCGARWRPPRWAVVILVSLLGLVVLAAITGSEERPAPTAPAPSKPAKSDIVTGPAIDTTLPELLAAYRENEVAADARYRGKILRVTAIVGRVGKDAVGRPYVALHLGGKPDGFHAPFASDAGLAELKPWQEIVMRCRGDGLFGGALVLEDCVLAPPP